MSTTPTYLFVGGPFNGQHKRSYGSDRVKCFSATLQRVREAGGELGNQPAFEHHFYSKRAVNVLGASIEVFAHEGTPDAEILTQLQNLL